jgi:hypothetical protein
LHICNDLPPKHLPNVNLKFCGFDYFRMKCCMDGLNQENNITGKNGLDKDPRGEWRRGTSPLRSLRTGLEPLGSSGSHYPAFVNGFTFSTGSSHKLVDL